MPSFEHEILVELFRENGQLAAELLRTVAGISVDHARVGVASIDLSQVVPTEYRADAVVILYDHNDRAVAGVIVEVQRSVDHDKERTWPAYVANLHAKLACATLLLVIAPMPTTAAWARRPIELGHPGFCLTPIVVGFDDVPWILERDAALHLPELAMLSVLAHPELLIAESALAGITQLPKDQSRLYWDVIRNALPEAIRQRMEARMKDHQYHSELARRFYAPTEEEIREEGREQGSVQALSTVVVALARLKLGAEYEDRIAEYAAVTCERDLKELVVDLARASNAAEAHAVLKREYRW
jgi:hypothetical protein